MAKNDKKWLGFSLIELMAVVAIMGVLVSLALPRFRTFLARARMGEAIHNLGVVNSLQKSYRLHYEMFGEDNVYWNREIIGNGSLDDRCRDGEPGSSLQNKLGFRVEDCNKLRYDYYGRGATNDEAKNEDGWQRIYPGCFGTGSSDDIWELHRNTTSDSPLKHTQDIIEKCK